MSAESLFPYFNLLVLPGWLLLAVAPRWPWSARVIAPVIIPAILAVAYLVLIVTNFGTGEGGFTTLSGVASLFDDPNVLLAGWIHYLAFDLFIGAWEVRDAQRLRIGHGYVLPCLVLTFMLGPIGLLLYFSIKLGLGRQGVLRVE